MLWDVTSLSSRGHEDDDQIPLKKMGNSNSID
jgi:hypothetical protein